MCAVGFELRQPDGRALTVEEASEKIASDLAREPRVSAKSWNVAIPPCFGEASFVHDVAMRLREEPSRPLVAVIEPDSLAGIDGLIAELHAQWTAALPGDHSLPHGASQSAVLKAVFGGLAPGRRAIIVMSRFHKVLEHADAWFLGALRSAEEQHNLCILTTAPLSLDAFQRLDSNHRLKLTISNFGDTHSKCVATAPSWEACSAELEAAGIGKDERRWLHDLCGGYPECINAVVAAVRSGTKCDRGTSGSVHHFRALVDGKLKQFIQSMLRVSKKVYFDAIVDYHHGVEREASALVLEAHEWHGILLDEQGELRAERLGPVAAAEAFRLAVEDGQVGQTLEGILGVAQRMYLQRQYDNADRFLQRHANRIDRTARGVVLLANAGIMAMLYRGEGLGEDIDWQAVKMAADAAIASLHSLREKKSLRRFDVDVLSGRYSELGDVAGRIAECITSLDPETGKLVDVLAASKAGSERDARLACLLLVLRYEAGLRCHGKTAACQAVLPLPEQAYRLWAEWGAGVSHNENPDPEAEEWQDVEQVWRGGGQFVRVNSRGRFTSFRSFAMYALAKYLRSSASSGRAPEEELIVLGERLTFFENVRNRRAHDMAYTREETRDRFFELIDRWLEAAVSVCPCAVSRGELTDVVAPLPILDEHGVLLHAD